MSRYFDSMRVVIERHDGPVEKSIGDADMTVFGGGLTTVSPGESRSFADGIRRCEEILRDVNGDRRLEADASAHLGVFEAMRGNFHEARRLVDRHMEILRDLGLKYEEFLANSIMRWDVEMLAGEAAAAERAVRAPFDATFVSGESRGRMAFALRIACAVCAQGRYAEALRYAEADSERGGPFVREQILWLRASARASAGLENSSEA